MGMILWLKLLAGLCVAVGIVSAGLGINDLNGTRGVDTSALDTLCAQGNAYACQTAREMGGLGGLARQMLWAQIVGGVLFAAFFGSLFAALALILERLRERAAEPADAAPPPARRRDPTL